MDDAPWGFAPFHYGRWVYIETVWVWVPGPIVVRPVYAPARTMLSSHQNAKAITYCLLPVAGRGVDIPGNGKIAVVIDDHPGRARLRVHPVRPKFIFRLPGTTAFTRYSPR